MPAVAGNVDIAVFPEMNRNCSGEYPITYVYNLSKYGHSSTPNGLSMVGEEIGIELKDWKDLRVMLKKVCAGAPDI